ncbi:GMC oxidoreductase [Sphingomonas sp.]|uniref:GMC oxidoreductase n=1 Tax=Sphingomonas sp. TaxID=28214 RepID=UPI0035B4885B
MDTHYDLIVIGSGPGGASLAQALAPTGKRILILERGDYLPREEANWSAKAVFVDGRYQADETWVARDGREFQPQLHYYVGGNSKVYGAALFRLRERDFEEVAHTGGTSPAWPLSYTDFAPWYDAAETLFHVHGCRGEDPLDPGTAPYPYVPVRHEPKVQELPDRLAGIGLHPFHLPLGIRLDQKEDGFATPTSTCMRCSFFDGFPCLLNGKADAQVMCIDPMLAAHDNVTLLTGAYAERLETDASGRRVTGVQVTRGGQAERYTADTVVVACGALSSALLLLRSVSDAHPAGLANGSGLVGRNYMRHEMAIVMAVMKETNDTVFQKTLALSDFYFGADDWNYPLGLIQMCATSHAEQIKGEAPFGSLMQHLPDMPFEELARHSMDFWLQAEDLPDPNNRVYYRDGRVHLDVTPTNAEALDRLKARLKKMLSDIGWPAMLLDRSLYLGKDIPLAGTAHQAGTCRFGTDPATSVLDLDCRAHEVDNLYITDASFFPSIGAVNPTLTIIANALRVADILKARL